MFNYKSKLNGKTFVEACKANKIALYLASHHHSAQVWSFDYANLATIVTKQQKGAVKFEKGADVFNCFPTDCKAWTQTDSVTLDAPEKLYVVLVGNSGRYFDPITPSTNSYGTFLFGRANNSLTAGDSRWKDATTNVSTNYYGGAMVSITPTAIKAQIFDSADFKNAAGTLTLNLVVKKTKRNRKLKKAMN